MNAQIFLAGKNVTGWQIWKISLSLVLPFNSTAVRKDGLKKRKKARAYRIFKRNTGKHNLLSVAASFDVRPSVSPRTMSLYLLTIKFIDRAPYHVANKQYGGRIAYPLVIYFRHHLRARAFLN